MSSVVAMGEKSSSDLLSLLRWLATTNESVDVRGVRSLAHEPLDSLPSLPDNWRCALVRHHGIRTRSALTDGALHKAALAVPCPEKDGVDGQQDPAALGEGNGGEHDTEPEQDLKTGDKSHGSIVVFFDKSANVIRERRRFRGRPASRGSTRSTRLLRRSDSGDEVGPGVGGDVEDGVDHEGQQGKRHLARKEPHERHHYRVTISRSRPSSPPSRATYPDIAHSHPQPKPADSSADAHPHEPSRGTPCRPQCHTSQLPRQKRCDKRSARTVSKS